MPGESCCAFGNVIGSGCEGTAPPGWMLNTSGSVTPGGRGIGTRSIGTGVIVIWRTGLKSGPGPMIRVPAGIVTTKPGIVGVVAWKVVVTVPVGSFGSVGSVIGWAVSSFGR